MASIDLFALNIAELTDLVGKAQTERASRHRQPRKDLRSDLESRDVVVGYKMRDIFPQFRSGGANGTQHRKMLAKFRNPQNPEEAWSGSKRSPKWVQAILAERGTEMAAFKGILMYHVSAS